MHICSFYCLILLNMPVLYPVIIQILTDSQDFRVKKKNHKICHSLPQTKDLNCPQLDQVREEYWVLPNTSV